MRQWGPLAAAGLGGIAAKYPATEGCGADGIWKTTIVVTGGRLAIAADIDDIGVSGIGCQRQVNTTLTTGMNAKQTGFIGTRQIHCGPRCATVSRPKYTAQLSARWDNRHENIVRISHRNLDVG